MEYKKMDEKSVDPNIFTWTIKIGTAIITFMAGILVYMHRKIHDMDKEFAINQERDILRDKTLGEVKVTVTRMDGKLNTAIEMFQEQQIRYNEEQLERKELATLVVDQKEVIEDYRKLRKM